MRTFFADCTFHKSSIAQIAEFVNKTGGNVHILEKNSLFLALADDRDVRMQNQI